MAEVWGSTGRQSKRERSNTEDGKKWFGFIVHIITDTALQRVTSRLDRSFGFELHNSYLLLFIRADCLEKLGQRKKIDFKRILTSP